MLLQDGEDDDEPKTIAKLEEEKKRKADQWFQEQVMSGAVGDDNPNFIPVRKAAKLL